MKRDKATPAPNTNVRDRTDPSCPLPDPYKVISDNHEEQKVLEKLQNVLRTFYIACIRSFLDYGALAIVQAKDSDINRLERFQN